MLLPFSSPIGYEHLVRCDAPDEAHWFVFRGDELLVEMGPMERPSDDLRVKARPAWARLPLRKNHNWLGPGVQRTLYLGRLAGQQLWAAELPDKADAPAGMAWSGLRTLFTVLDDAHFALAGFVEPGESLEQCLAREVQEEVGVQVTNTRYFASQPWPFPHSLMIAFVCEWVSGEVKPQEAEIEEAKWFKVLQLPKLPSKISIARRLIDDVCQELVEKSNEKS